MSTEEILESELPGSTQAGIIPPSRPLRRPKTSESLVETPSQEEKEEEEDAYPHVPARPSGGSSIKSTEIDTMDQIKPSGLQEKTVPNIPSRPTHTHPSNAVQEPHIPTRPTHESNVIKHEVDLQISARPIKNETALEQENVNEPHIPARPMRKNISVDQVVNNEPHIPPRPSIRKGSSTNEDIVLAGSHEGSIATDETNESDQQSPSISKMQHDFSNSNDIPEIEHNTQSTQDKVNPEFSNPPQEKNKEEEEEGERAGRNMLLSDKSVNDTTEPENVTDEAETQYSDNKTGLVEPLMPKRPIRRTATDIPAPFVPLRPRKAATSVGLQTVQVDHSQSVKEEYSAANLKENIQNNEESDFEETVEDEKEVQQVDIISSGSLDANKYLLQNAQTTESTTTTKSEQISENISNEGIGEVTEPLLEPSNESIEDESDEQLQNDILQNNSNDGLKEEQSNDIETETEKPELAPKEEEPSIPSRPVKKGPPPVPKKPSSKIAAFHQMLQRQQIKNLGLDETAPATEGLTESPSTPITEDDTSAQTKSIPARPLRMVGNMNGMFALPGMVPGGVLPPELSKKLGISSGNQSSDGDISSSTTGLGDVRQKRARGPRGRKLPTKISGIKKVVDSTENNDIETFNNWTIILTPIKVQKNPNTEEAETCNNSEEGETPKGHMNILALDDNELVVSEEEEPKQVENPIEVERTTSQTPISVGEMIEVRDGDERPIYLEQQVEEMAESLMQQEMLKGDIDEFDTEENGQDVVAVDDSTPEDGQMN